MEEVHLGEFINEGKLWYCEPGENLLNIEFSPKPEDGFAKGGFGVLFRGHYDGKDCAVKVIRGKDDEHIQQIGHEELEVLRYIRQSHQRQLRFDANVPSHIVELRGGAKLGNYFAIVTEYLPGPTLRDILINTMKNGLIPNPRYSLLAGIASLAGIEELHRNGYFHRDISPEQFKSTLDGRIKTLDVGCSLKRYDEMIVGKPQNIDPVIFSEVEDISSIDKELSDVFALAVLLHTIFTGRCPFHFLNVCKKSPEMFRLRSRKRNYIENIINKIPFIKNGIGQIVSKALSPIPEKRPNIETLIRRLTSIKDITIPSLKYTKPNCGMIKDAIAQYHAYISDPNTNYYGQDKHYARDNVEPEQKILDVDSALFPLTLLTRKGNLATFGDLDYSVEKFLNKGTLTKLLKAELTRKLFNVGENEKELEIEKTRINKLGLPELKARAEKSGITPHLAYMEHIYAVLK
jgi:serine/threonine protein kinase